MEIIILLFYRLNVDISDQKNFWNLKLVILGFSLRKVFHVELYVGNLSKSGQPQIWRLRTCLCEIDFSLRLGCGSSPFLGRFPHPPFDLFCAIDFSVAFSPVGFKFLLLWNWFFIGWIGGWSVAVCGTLWPFSQIGANRYLLISLSCHQNT